MTLLRLHPDTHKVVGEEGKRSSQLRIDSVECEDGERCSLFIKMDEETTANPGEGPECRIIVRHPIGHYSILEVDSFTIIGDDMYQFGAAEFDDFEKGVQGADLSSVEPISIQNNLDDITYLETDLGHLEPINRVLKAAIANL